jgi:hypothetical protein
MRTTDRVADRAIHAACRFGAVSRAVVITFAAALLLPLPSGPAFGMTVQEAYEAMDGHRHTDFDPHAPGLVHAEAIYLTELFELVDLAIVEKMQTWVWFQSEGRKGASFRESRTRVDQIIAEFVTLEAPARLAEVQRLMVEAIQEQRAFFQAWQEAFDARGRDEESGQAHAARGRLMESSSAKLHAAYNQLRALFPTAGRRNLDAFYDHLCVLDMN